MNKLTKILCCIFCMVVLSSTAAGITTVSATSKNTVTTSISKIEPKGKDFKVTWKKKSKIKGYQIQYSTSSKFKKSETQTKTVSKAKTTSATIKNLKGCNKKYYVRVRTYKVVKDKKVYSSWSKASSVTTLKHKYSAATCTKAKTCKYCSKTTGEKLGHKWAAATCTSAKVCTRCKKTSGEALGHKWIEADYTKPETCANCNKTNGTPLINEENYHGFVYTGGENSKRYHYEAECAGKYSHEIKWEEVTRRGLTPCKTCVEK